MAIGAGIVGQDYLSSHVADVVVHAKQRLGLWFAGARHSMPCGDQACPGFPMISFSHTRCSCAILSSHMKEEQSSGAEPSTARQLESAQGCRRRLPGGLRQISSQGAMRAQTRTALSVSSKATYRGPSDERTPSVLLYLPTRVSGWKLSRRCQHDFVSIGNPLASECIM